MKIFPLPFLIPFLSLFSLPSLAQLPQDPDQLNSWMCRQGLNSVLVEAKEDKVWKPLIEQQGWTCQFKPTEVPVGSLRFSCEPTHENFLSLITMTWLGGTDEKRLMGQWMHQLAEDQKMICTIASVELWDE